MFDFFTKIYAPAMWNGGFPKEEPPLHSTMAWASTSGWYLTAPHVGGLGCCFTTSSATFILLWPSTTAGWAGFDDFIAARVNEVFFPLCGLRLFRRCLV
jgi:hypothetical protein